MKRAQLVVMAFLVLVLVLGVFGIKQGQGQAAKPAYPTMAQSAGMPDASAVGVMVPGGPPPINAGTGGPTNVAPQYMTYATAIDNDQSPIAPLDLTGQYLPVAPVDQSQNLLWIGVGILALWLVFRKPSRSAAV